MVLAHIRCLKLRLNPQMSVLFPFKEQFSRGNLGFEHDAGTIVSCRCEFDLQHYKQHQVRPYCRLYTFPLELVWKRHQFLALGPPLGLFCHRKSLLTDASLMSCGAGLNDYLTHKKNNNRFYLAKRPLTQL